MALYLKFLFYYIIKPTSVQLLLKTFYFQHNTLNSQPPRRDYILGIIFVFNLYFYLIKMYLMFQKTRFPFSTF